MTILDVKRAYENWLMSLPGVFGVGISLEGIEVNCLPKMRKTLLRMVPRTLEGFPIIIKEGPMPRPLLFTQLLWTKEQLIGKWRPAGGGVSIAHEPASGTLGTRVYDSNTHEPLFLSCHHIFAPPPVDWKIGDEIFQPAKRYFQAEVIAHLHRTCNLQYCDPNAPMSKWPVNYSDSAVAKPIFPEHVATDNIGIGTVRETVEPQLGMEIQKVGIGSGLTTATISTIHHSTLVPYTETLYAWFKEQIQIKSPRENPFSIWGDSGSLICDMYGRAVGMLFSGAYSGDKHITVASRMPNIFSDLNVMFPAWTETPNPAKLLPECVIDADCPPGYICINGKCWMKAKPALLAPVVLMFLVGIPILEVYLILKG